MATIIKAKELIIKGEDDMLELPMDVREDIAAYWREQTKLYPGMFNGPVYSVLNMENNDGNVVFECALSDYANYKYTINSLHRMMETEVNPAEAGQYKSHDNMIMEYLPDGTRHIRFKPVAAKETSKAMEQLLLAYYDARQNSNIADLLLIPCFIVDFLCIHPYLDGNGRVSRLLTVLLLYMSGYDIGRYISIEGQINKYKESYYEALEHSSAKWHDNQNDYTPFMVNFMQILYRCYKELDESFMDITLKRAKKSERVESVLLNAIVPISKSDILDKVPDISVKTVELVLSKMIKEDKIVKIGSYRDARYMKK